MQSPRFLIALASLVGFLAMSSAGAQSSGVLQWCAGNGFPPGPFAAPDMGCLPLNRTDEYGNVWTDAAIDPESWSGRTTGGYPGSFALCMVTQSVIGPGQADLGTEHSVLPAIYAVHSPGPCPKASPRDVGSSNMHVPLCVSIIGVLFLALFGSLWACDRERSKICKSADPFMREGHAKSEWLSTYDKVVHSSARSKRMTLIGRYIDLMPAPLGEKYRRYRLLRIIPLAIFGTIVLVGIVALWICR